jgi:transglutaminase-like putative cysteine protease
VRSPPIEAPRQVAKLEITLEGVPATFETPVACRREADRLACALDGSAANGQGDPAHYLKATLAAPSNLGVISNLARSIAREGTADQKIERLLAWMDENIAKEAIDAFSALDVLQSRRGECQGHAYLFAAFARSLGIPTRVVNGLVYSEPHAGFLYHTWNEAWIDGGWRPVDATFGQARADATHIKLIEGETPAELLPLVGLVGRLRVVSVSPTARW